MKSQGVPRRPAPFRSVLVIGHVSPPPGTHWHSAKRGWDPIVSGVGITVETERGYLARCALVSADRDPRCSSSSVARP